MIIGIVTFWQTKDNYGQMLQNFALQWKLKELGHKPYLIRYAHSEARQTHWQDRFLNFLRRIKHLDFQPHKSLLFHVSEKDKQRNFDEFRNKYLRKSLRIYYSLKELQKAPPQADAYIVGSDQVWSKFLYIKENEAFFLNFGKRDTMRLSYAASFGCTEYPEKIIKKLHKNLLRFKGISVREVTGQKIVYGLGLNVDVVLDPTLLLTVDDYVSCFNLTKCNQKGEDLFIYSLNMKSADEIGWNDLKQSLNGDTSKIIVTPSSGYIDSVELFGDEVCYKYSTITEWLDTIRLAKMVITPSFHGIVFCILFHTPFVYIPLGGSSAKGNSRVLDMLHYLQIQGRVYDSNTSYNRLMNDSLIDWDFVDRKVDEFRKSSVLFLQKHLK